MPPLKQRSSPTLSFGELYGSVYEELRTILEGKVGNLDVVMR